LDLVGQLKSQLILPTSMSYTENILKKKEDAY